MRDYIVTITEILETTVAVEAKDKDEALDMVQSQYKDEEIILTGDDHRATDFSVEEI